MTQAACVTFKKRFDGTLPLPPSLQPQLSPLAPISSHRPIREDKGPSAMFSPDTVQPRRSVWDYVDRVRLKVNWTLCIAQDFSRVAKSSGRRANGRCFQSPLRSSSPITLRLCYGVRYVMAATVQIGERGLLIRLAANEGVCARVKIALQSIFPTLEECARKGEAPTCSPRMISDAALLEVSRNNARRMCWNVVVNPNNCQANPRFWHTINGHALLAYPPPKPLAPIYCHRELIAYGLRSIYREDCNRWWVASRLSKDVCC